MVCILEQILGMRCIGQPAIFPSGPFVDKYPLPMPPLKKPGEQKKTCARTFWPFIRILAIQLPAEKCLEEVGGREGKRLRETECPLGQ